MPLKQLKIEENLAKIDPNNIPEQKETIFSKMIIIISSIFIILLLISLTFVYFPIGPILQGKIQSQSIQENEIIFPDETLIFENNVHQQLQQYYSQHQKAEFSACLQGFITKNKTYHLVSIYFPKMYQQSFSHVTFESCSKDTIILLHSHPYKRCLASETDIKTLTATQQLNPNVKLLIMCEPQRFSIYS